MSCHVGVDRGPFCDGLIMRMTSKSSSGFIRWTLILGNANFDKLAPPPREYVSNRRNLYRGPYSTSSPTIGTVP